MPSWKKLISSGSSAVLSSLTLDSPLAVAQGGTGAATLTSGYALLGNGTSAPQMINSTADSTMLVGNGSTMVAETGGTLRTSIGVDVAGTDNSTNVTLAGTPNYLTLSGQEITLTKLDITDDTNLVGGTNITLSTNTLNVDDAFLVNDASDTTSGTITAGGFTTTGTWTMDTSAGGTTGITNINITNAFTDDDVTIMSAGAIKEKIEGYSYSTTTGTVTSVGTTGTVNGLTLSGTVTTSGNLTLGGTLAINNGDWSGTDLSVANGGTGASTFTDGGILFGNGTDAIQASAVLAAGEILIGDGTTEPTILDVGSASGIEILGTIGTGVWNGTEIGLGYGGTELVGETDGKIVVADGSGAPVHLDIGSSTAITILGTVATGTWEGTTVAVDQGGTGVTTMTALKNALDGETWSFANAVNIDATTSSTNKESGALIVDGGLGVNENIHAGGDVVAYASSDERLKDNLQVIQDPLDKVGQISGYEFDWNEKSPEWAQERGHDIGVVAQEIQKVHPEIVIERTNGYLGVDYKRIIPLLIESIKELKQEVEDLKKKVS
jgi:hypothetical protein